MMKKGLSILLSLVLLFGALSVLPVAARAEESDIAEVGLESTGNSTLDAFINDSRWTNGVSWSGGQTPKISSFQCWGCCAYCADYVKYCYGINNPRSGSVFYSVSEIRAGDVLTVGNQSDGTGHWFVCLKRSGNSLYVAEGNYSNKVRIGWNYTISGSKFAEDSRSFTAGYHYLDDTPIPSNAWISASRRALPIGWDISFTFGANNAEHFDIGIDRNGTRIITETVTSGKSYYFTETGEYSAYVTAYNSSGWVDSNKVTFSVWQARNFGDRFIAAIINTATGVAVTAENNGNVVIKQYKGTDDQLWLFERIEKYKNYKITNVKTGKCLDDVDFGTTDNTNIIARDSNDSDAERWYIRANGTGYSIVPKCAPHGCMDMYGGDTTDGNNIAMWPCVEGNGNQIFSLQIVDTPAYSETFNNHKYELYNTSVTWKDAFQFCEQQGGHLVTINSQEEQDFINGILSHSTHNRIWAGGLDAYTEGKWQWITGETFSFKNWATGEPNNQSNEDYLMLSKSDGKWNDVDDIFYNTDNEYSFICEYDDVIDPARVSLEKTFDYNNHRYEIYSGSLDWLSAKLFCEQKGGHLVTVTTSEENSTIINNTKALNHDAYWLGLTDVELESKWHWITNEAYSYKNWNDKEPNNSGCLEDYAVYVPSTGKWNDLTGRAVSNTDIGFICEYDTIEITDDMVTVKDVVTTSDADTITPQVTVKWNNTALMVNTDYTVNASTDINNGIGTVTIIGKGIYSGSVTKSFKITIDDRNKITDSMGNQYYANDGEIVTFIINLTSQRQVNYLNGILYYNQDILEPIITDDIGYHAPNFVNGQFHILTPGQIEFDVYSNKPVSLNNTTIVKMQFRVTAKGKEGWLAHEFKTSEFTWDNQANYGLETLVLTNQELYNPNANILGDVDGDGEATVIDATYIQRYDTKMAVPVEEDVMLSCGDIDVDGDVTIVDATFIQRYATHIKVPYSIGEPIA